MQKMHQYTLMISAYHRKEEYKTNVWDTEEKRLQYVEIPFLSTTYPSGFLTFLVCILSTLSCNDEYLFRCWCMDEEEEFGAVVTKTTGQDQRAQASSVLGTASSSVTQASFQEA